MNQTHASTSKVTCLPCKEVKKKCDGSQPICARCQRLKLECKVQTYFPRRRYTDLLEQKVQALELQLASLHHSQELPQSTSNETRTLVRSNSLAAQHNQTLFLYSLLHKIHSLETCPSISFEARGLGQTSVIPLFPHTPLITVPPFSQFGRLMEGRDGADQEGVGYRPIVLKSNVEAMFSEWNPDDGMSYEQSLCLIRLLLPYRFQYYFFIELPTLFSGLSGSPNSPQSLHPCFLNALYLCSCFVAPSTSSLKKHIPYFLSQTRHHLSQSLMFADRLSHFMWASVLLGAYFMYENRMTEAYVTISTVARFALGCGLDGTTPESFLSPNSLHTDNNMELFGMAELPTLPRPDSLTTDEATDRYHLSHAIYMMDRTLSMTTGYPGCFSPKSSLSAEWLRNIAVLAGAMTLEGENTLSHGGLLPNELVDLVNSEQPMLIQCMLLYDRVERLAFYVKEHGSSAYTSTVRRGLSFVLAQFLPKLPPFSDMHCTHASEEFSTSNPHIVVAHSTCYGSIILLESMADDGDLEAHNKMLDALEKMTNLHKDIRSKRGLVRIQGFLLPMVHALNASRILTSYLQKARAKGSAHRIAKYYKSLDTLLEFLYEAVVWFPAWAHALATARALFPHDVNEEYFEVLEA